MSEWNRLRECCGNCKYWELSHSPTESDLQNHQPYGDSGDYRSNCRRHAPTVNATSDWRRPIHPRTSREAYCGDFEPGAFHRAVTVADIRAELERRYPAGTIIQPSLVIDRVWIIKHDGFGSHSIHSDDIVRDLREGRESRIPTPVVVRDAPNDP